MSGGWEDAHEYLRKNQESEKDETKKEKRKVEKHGEDKSKQKKRDYSVDIIYQGPTENEVETGHVKKDKWEDTLKNKNGAH